jgi:hypothetical protein
MTSVRRATLGAVVLALALAGSAAGAEPSAAPAVEQARQIARDVERERGLPVTGVTTTAGVATLELLDLETRSSRRVATGSGIHFTLCHKALRPCALPARRARLQALVLARRTLLETSVSLVVVALPQSATRHLQLVFERDVLELPEASGDPITRERLYAMGGVVTVGADDSLVLVRLR